MKNCVFIISTLLMSFVSRSQTIKNSTGETGEIKQVDRISDSIRASILHPRPGLYIFGSKLANEDEFTAAFYIDTASRQLLAVVQNELFTIEPDSGTYNAAPLIDTLTYTYYFRENKLFKVTVQQNVGQPDMVNAVFYFKDNAPYYKISIVDGKTTVIDDDDDVTPIMVTKSGSCIKKSEKYIDPGGYTSKSN